MAINLEIYAIRLNDHVVIDGKTHQSVRSQDVEFLHRDEKMREVYLQTPRGDIVRIPFESIMYYSMRKKG